MYFVKGHPVDFFLKYPQENDKISRNEFASFLYLYREQEGITTPPPTRLNIARVLRSSQIDRLSCRTEHLLY